MLQRFESQVVPCLDTLPHSIIHNDANDHNVLAAADGASVGGIIDFGDSVYTATVFELSVTIAYGACLVNHHPYSFCVLPLDPLMFARHTTVCPV